MDVYEVTVGRFRQFVEAGKGTQTAPPADGSGANPNLAGSGWQSGWNTELAATTAALMAGLKCHSTYQTWTDSPGENESRPIDCVTWYEAFSFCIWDGGRLATEAEWHYAAAGGSEQRWYPWSTAGGTSIDCTHASYDCPNNSCGNGIHGCQATDIIVVGTKPGGKGRWGQADLGGNVSEWALDGYAAYQNPCNNCANLTDTSNRVFRGGTFSSQPPGLSSYQRGGISAPWFRSNGTGVRCVRTP